MDRRTWTDERVEAIMGTLLRTGVILAAVVVLTGGVVYLLHHGAEPTHYGTFHMEDPELRSLGGVLRGAYALEGPSIIQLGLLLLMATPVARVLFAVFGFAQERDRTYVWITLVVFAILMLSLWSGVASR